MSLITTAVTFKLLLPDGAPAQGVKLTASLSSIQIDGGIIVRARRDGITNASGIVVLDLWPNTRGDGASHYVIRHSGLAAEGLRADEFRIAVGETGTANADDLLVDVLPGSAAAPSPSAMAAHMQSTTGHLSGAQVAAGAVGHVALGDGGVLLDADGNPISTNTSFTTPNAVMASDANADAVELSPGDGSGAAGSILTAWGEPGVYPPVQELRWLRPLIDADPPGSTTFGTPLPWARVLRSLILSEEFFDDVSGNFLVPIRANCVRILLSGDTVLYGGNIAPAFPCRLVVMQPPSAAYQCRFSTPAEEGENVRWIHHGNTWLDLVQSSPPVFTNKPGGADIFDLTDHFPINSPVYVSHIFSSGVVP